MVDVKLFGRSRSTYVRSARLALEEKGVAYELDEMSPGDNQKEPYLSEHHPFGRIPAFQYRDFKLYETQAIIRYVDENFSGPSMQPNDVRERAAMNQVIGIVDAYMWISAAASIIRNQLMAPKFGLEIDHGAVELAIPKAKTCVSEIGRILGSKPYIASSNLSLADLMVAPIVNYLRQTAFGNEFLPAHQNILDWMARIEQRPSGLRVLEAL